MEVNVLSTIYEKIEYLSRIENLEILDYLRERTFNIRIDNYGESCNRIFEIMRCKPKRDGDVTPLSGWCGEVAILLGYALDNDAYIERGNICLSDTSYGDSNYFHCWTCFNYKGKKYVIDPCNNIIATKEDYYRLFKPNVLGRVLGEDIKKSLLEAVNYNIRFGDTDYSFVKNQDSLSSPIKCCSALFKFVDDDLRVRFMNFYDTRYEVKHQKALDEFEKMVSNKRK